MKKIILLVVNFFTRKRQCNHRFKLEEVCIIKIDPKCVKCGKTMNELTYKFK